MKDLSIEALLVQLGYSPNESIISNLKQIITTTPSFNEIQRHIIALNEKIKPHGAYIGISNSSDYLKIKLKNSSDFLEQEIEEWAKKYKIALIKNPNHYYITGKGSI